MQPQELIQILLSEGAIWEYDGKFHVLGGPGSGHHGHRGIPGRRGGSLPSGGRALPQPWRDGAYGDIAELVPVSEMEKYQEHHWTRRYHPRLTQEEYDKLSDDIAQHGFEDPIILDYNPTNGYAQVIEGNTRLAIARDLGLKHIPARLVRGSYVGPLTKNAAKVENSKLITEDYVPGNISPSMVFRFGELSSLALSEPIQHILSSSPTIDSFVSRLVEEDYHFRTNGKQVAVLEE